MENLLLNFVSDKKKRDGAGRMCCDNVSCDLSLNEIIFGLIRND